jgi:hypothetical protein
MDSNSRHQILKRPQTSLARGVPFDLTTLAQVGVSAPLAARYAESGWLVRLAPVTLNRIHRSRSAGIRTSR